VSFFLRLLFLFYGSSRTSYFLFIFFLVSFFFQLFTAVDFLSFHADDAKNKELVDAIVAWNSKLGRSDSKFLHPQVMFFPALNFSWSEQCVGHGARVAFFLF
jgi:hypothetical protein